MSDYIKTVFWQIEITAPKEHAAQIEDFFLRSGAQSTFELLYAEGRTSNLVEDNTQLYFFFPEEFPARAFVPMALATLGLPDLPFEVGQVRYADYLKEFERTFRAFRLTDRTALVPPWDTDNPEIRGVEKKLWLVPGMAFGTGKHATTQLMVEFIESNVKTTDTVIDIGSGSGILAIAAMLWGAKSAWGVDVETLAVESAAANKRLNEENHGASYACEFAVGDFSALHEHTIDEAHTVFLANILPNIFEANAKDLQYGLAHCRAWALSGIPESQQQSFTAFLKQIWPGAFEVRTKEDWQIYYFSGD
jgi:ribosomal protein L11 methyltransferase